MKLVASVLALRNILRRRTEHPDYRFITAVHFLLSCERPRTDAGVVKA